MATIEQRTAAREAALLQTLNGQRRLAEVADYVYDKRQEAFWDLKDGTLHGKDAVDASIPISNWRVVVEEGEEAQEAGAAPRGRGRPRARRERLIPPHKDIMRIESDQFVEGSSWWPGKPQIITDWFIDKDGFQFSEGRRIYNQYRPSPNMKGDSDAAWPWVDHVKKLWPNVIEHEFFFDYCAHMMQNPAEKCNVGIVLSGTQGIGKDAALHPVKEAIGQWNSKGIMPDMLFSPFQPWTQTLLLVIDEIKPAKDAGKAVDMYNVLKPYIAAPPNTLPMNEKNMKSQYSINLMRVVMTTNHLSALYIPPEDRRLFIMHSFLPRQWNDSEGKPEYFRNLFRWMEKGGIEAVNAWLRCRDISKFNAKADAPHTAMKQGTSNAWDSTQDDAVGEAIDRIGSPDVFFGFELLQGEFDGRDEIVKQLQASSSIKHRMARSGYYAVKKENGKSKWSFTHEGRVLKSAVAFVKQELLDRPDIADIINSRGKELVSKPPGSNVFTLNKNKF